ncbi:MAG: hypothetical protein V4757_12020 [Pseudomonadota bacterium]
MNQATSVLCLRVVASLCLSALVPGSAAHAQSTPAALPGDYYINERDVASAIRLSPDGTYRFFTMIGSVDEQDEGTWSLEGDRIVARSRTPDTPPQLGLVASNAGPHEGVRIELTGKDAKALSYQLWVKLEGQGGKIATTRRDGDGAQYSTMKAPVKRMTIALIGGFRDYGEFVVVPAAPDHNHFVLSAVAGNLGVMRLDDVTITREGTNLKFGFPGDKMKRGLIYYRTEPQKTSPAKP